MDGVELAGGIFDWELLFVGRPGRSGTAGAGVPDYLELHAPCGEVATIVSESEQPERPSRRSGPIVVGIPTKTSGGQQKRNLSGILWSP
jgi:hypothetical protein